MNNWVYGHKVAEVPLVGTRLQYRRHGMCHILMDELEKLEHLPSMVASVWSDDNNLQLEATTQFRKLLFIVSRLASIPLYCLVNFKHLLVDLDFLCARTLSTD